MKIIKRNGAEEVFDIKKIVVAVTKADTSSENRSLTDSQIEDIAEFVEFKCNKLNRAVSVEEIQDMVENQIMATGAFDLARRYVRYRFKRSLVRKANTTDNRILSLIECNNEDVKQENSNKNPAVNSVQRDYMAGEVSRDLTQRMLLPEDIVEADNGGYAPEWHGHQRHYDREASQFFNSMQYRDTDHSPGGQQPVWRTEHFSGTPGSVCSGVKR